MAANRKTPARKVRFELTFSGIAGIGVVCFCIFLWMFLLGVWTGQTLLLPSEEPVAESGSQPTAVTPDQQQVAELVHIEPVREKKVRKGD